MKHKVDTFYGSYECDSLMEAMDFGRIFSIKQKGNSFRVEDSCDRYFSIYLNSEQLAELGRELIELSKT